MALPGHTADGPAGLTGAREASGTPPRADGSPGKVVSFSLELGFTVFADRRYSSPVPRRAASARADGVARRPIPW